MDGVLITPQKIISNPKGDIMHALKAGDVGYDGFGEAYFSKIKKNEIKGWKKHNLMTLNILVPVGQINFVIYDGLKFFNVVLSENNYARLTIKPKLWVAFQGLGQSNMLVNLASEVHDPKESENLSLDEIDFNW